jgi:hypothetical protein
VVRELRRTWNRPWHVFRYNADFARENVERKVSPFGNPATNIPNMKARRLSVGRVIGKGKVVPVHIMKAYRWSRSIAPLNLNLSIRWK